MRSHLFRINGTWYFRYALSPRLVKALAVHEYREIRLSLYTTHHVHAKELANAYWLACRELVHSDLQALGILSIEDFKNHVRRSVMNHLPQQFTALIELTGSTETDRLVAALKILSAYNIPFFVLPPTTIKGTLYKKVNGDWDALVNVMGQQLPYMRIQSSLIHDAITCEHDWLEPQVLFNTVKGEEQMLRLAVDWKVGLHQLFIASDVPQHVITAIRKVTDTPPIAQALTKVEVKPSILLSKEIENYCAYKKNAWTEKTRDEFKMHLTVFKDMVGDKEVLQLTNDDYDYYIQNLPRWPVNRSKNPLYRDKNAREILSGPDPVKVIGPKTVETYYTTVTGFIQWTSDRNQGMNTSLLRMTPQTNERKGDGRLPFSAEQLALMFESEASLSFLEKTKHPYQKWITPLGLFTGARLDELCALGTKDVGVENGIHYIELNDNDDDTRKGKTENAVRRIPIHPVLVELGFLKFVEHKKAQGETRLFPECTWVKKHGYKKAASRWFGQYLDRLKITSDSYVFHSFRHNVSDLLTQNDSLKVWRICRYFGHALPSSEPESVQNYFKQRKLEHLMPVVDTINYAIDWTAYRKLTAATYK